ncbi:peptidase S8/S53 domain-containing protein [Zopfochytrium polystomum]|nr:peptidase S8/S53 domain-containing protein [Zopfochytrium polystomum]
MLVAAAATVTAAALAAFTAFTAPLAAAFPSDSTDPTAPPPPDTAATLPTQPAPAALLPNTFYVETSADQGDPVAHVLASLAAAGIPSANVTVRTTVQTPFMNAVSFELAGDRNLTDVVASLPILNFWPVGEVPRPAAMTVEAATAASAAAAEKIHIATGFGPGYKVAFGYDLVGDIFDGTAARLKPDADPIDNCSTAAHGSHVSGIVAGDASSITDPEWAPPVPWTGVAPGATLGAYRVFGCTGATAFDVISNAIYMAAADGADVINMSLGVGPSFSDYIASVAVERVSAAGVIVVTSNGNDNEGGYWAASSPANAEHGFGVAAFDSPTVLQFRGFLDDAPISFSPATANHSFGFPRSFDQTSLVVNNDSAIALNAPNDGCVAGNIRNATSKGLGLILYYNALPSCGTTKQCSNAFSRGYSYCLVVFPPGVDSTVGIVGNLQIPSASFDFATGSRIFNYTVSGQKFNLTVTNTSVQIDSPTAGTVAFYSSGGLTPDLLLKPDIGGVGNRVLSAISPQARKLNLFDSNYAVKSGTSMSAPYVAGAIALLLEAKGKQSFEAVKTRLMNTARPVNISQSTLVDAPARQGAGLVQIYDAVTSNTTVTPPSLSLNDTVRMHQHYTLTIANDFDTDVDYTVSSIGAAMVNWMNKGDDMVQINSNYTADYAKVTFDGDTQTTKTITIKAHSNRTINAHFTPPANADPSLLPIYNGYISVTNPRSSAVVTVPYAGVAGDWTTRAVFAQRSPTLVANLYRLAGPQSYTYGTPLPTPPTAVNVTKTPVVMSNTMSATCRFVEYTVAHAGGDAEAETRKALAALGFDLHAKELGLAVGQAGAKKTPMRFEGYLPRNTYVSTVQSIFPPPLKYWYGDVVVGPRGAANGTVVRVPAGTYSIKAKALKMFGRVGATGDSNYDVIEAAVTIVH